MPAIELADGQQIHGSGEHAHPGGARHRVEVDISRCGPREDDPLQQPLQGGNAKLMAALMCDARYHLGKGETHGEGGQEKNETGQGAGDTDIEKCPAGVDGRTNSYEGAEGSKE